jgi:hypothetical protein
MNHQPFTGVTTQDQVDRINQLVETYPQLRDFLSQDFFDQITIPGQSIYDVHPLLILLM